MSVSQVISDEYIPRVHLQIKGLPSLESFFSHFNSVVEAYFKPAEEMAPRVQKDSNEYKFLSLTLVLAWVHICGFSRGNIYHFSTP